MKILFIQTGGTIDKDYPKSAGAYAFEIHKPAVERILARANPSFGYKVISLLRKDSLDLTDKDRKLILETCLISKADKIIITHGTDTFQKTAKILSQIEDKVIILTGSSLPERFMGSDADFNIGVAIGATQTLKCGIYIAMNGRIFAWNRCRKNPKTGQFMEAK